MRFLFFSLPFFLHLANIIIVKGISLIFRLKQLFWLVLVNVVTHTACNFRGFKNICRNFSVATKTISNQSQYYLRGDKLINIKNPISYNRPRGPTDKASDYESGDSRFESWRGRFFFKHFIARGTNIFFSNPLYSRPPNRLWLDSLRAAVSLSDNREHGKAVYYVVQTTCDECMNQLFMPSMQSLDTYFLLWPVL